MDKTKIFIAQFGEKIIPTDYRWYRERTYYRVHAVMDDNAGNRELVDPEGWQANFIKLPFPILKVSNLTAKHFQNAIFYPPFGIDNNVDFFKDSNIPDQCGLANISDSAVRGISAHPSSDGTDFVYGLRIDTAPKVEANDLLDILITLIRHHTHQWWLLGPTNPFDSPIKISAILAEDRRLVDGFLKLNDNRGSNWFGMTSTQMMIGFEKPLTDDLWERAILDTLANRYPEKPSFYLHEAINAYMNSNNDICILRVCNCLEALERRARQIQRGGKLTSDYSLQLLKSSIIWQKEDKETLRKLFGDRGSIAHGNTAERLNRTPEDILSYLDLMMNYFNRYCAVVSASTSVPLTHPSSTPE